MSPKHRLFSSEEVAAALIRAGFREGKRIGSSHRCFLCETGGRRCRIPIVMGKKEIPRSTFEDILKEAGLTYEQFCEYARIKIR